MSYIENNCGCYDEDIEDIIKGHGKETASIHDIMAQDIPLKDKFWFLCKKCELTEEQNQKIAIDMAEIVLPIYEKRYPENQAPREAIEAAKQFIGGHISLETLLEKRRAAAAASAAYAAYAASAADAAAADAAAYAAYAAYADIKKQLEQYLIDFINNN